MFNPQLTEYSPIHQVGWNEAWDDRIYSSHREPEREAAQKEHQKEDKGKANGRQVGIMQYSLVELQYSLVDLVVEYDGASVQYFHLTAQEEESG